MYNPGIPDISTIHLLIATRRTDTAKKPKEKAKAKAKEKESKGLFASGSRHLAFCMIREFGCLMHA